MAPFKTDPSPGQSILMSGPGSTQRRRGDATTAIYLNVSTSYLILSYCRAGAIHTGRRLIDQVGSFVLM